MNNYKETPANYEDNDKFVVNNTNPLGKGKTYDTVFNKETGKIDVKGSDNNS